MDTDLILRSGDGFALSAVITKPGSDVAAEALWLHGLQVDKDEYLGFHKDGAHFLAEQGVRSLRFDFRGHGNSGGSYSDFTVAGQVLDAKAALASALKASGLGRLTVVATSFGAPPALVLAQRYPEQIKRVVLVAPVLSYHRTFFLPEAEWGRTVFGVEAIEAADGPGYLALDGDYRLGLLLLEEMRLFDPLSIIGETSVPVTILHGDADSMVPYGVSEAAAAVGDHVTLVTFPGMDHGFMDAMDEDGTSQASMRNQQAIYDRIAEACLE